MAAKKPVHTKTSPRKPRNSVRPQMASPLRPQIAAAATTTRPQGIAVAPGGGTVPHLPLRPPLETALDAVGREVRALFEAAKAEAAALRTEVATLTAELAQLRQRYESHSHTYEKTATGGDGQQWIELRFLQSYIDGEHPGHNEYGFWARGKSTPDSPPEHQTSGPSG